MYAETVFLGTVGAASVRSASMSITTFEFIIRSSYLPEAVTNLAAVTSVVPSSSFSVLITLLSMSSALTSISCAGSVTRKLIVPIFILVCEEL